MSVSLTFLALLFSLQAWEDEPPGPFQAVLDMHADAVESLHHVTHTSSKLQEEFDKVLL